MESNIEEIFSAQGLKSSYVEKIILGTIAVAICVFLAWVIAELLHLQGSILIIMLGLLSEFLILHTLKREHDLAQTTVGREIILGADKIQIAISVLDGTLVPALRKAEKSYFELPLEVITEFVVHRDRNISKSAGLNESKQ